MRKLNRHLKTAIILQALIGAWKLVFDSKTYQFIYNTYFAISHTYTLIFIGSQFLQAFVVLFRRDWEEFMANISITLLYTLAVLKIHFCRSKSIQDLFHGIEHTEDGILNSEDDDVKKIYLKYAKIANVSSMSYFVFGWVPLYLYFQFPKVPVTDISKTGNNTRMKLTVFSSWLPFNKYDHNGVANALQILGGTYGGSCSIAADATFFSLLIHSVGQIKVLQHYLENIYEYSGRMENENRIDFGEAELIFAKRCIVMYNAIIDSVTTLDKMLRTFMLFNFFQASFKMALLVLQILKQSTFDMNTFSIMMYFIYELSELYFFYWNANEILIESSDGICVSIFAGRWYKCGEQVKKLLLLTILRSKTPCKIRIGPIYDMDLTAMINIMRGCYVYVTTVYKFKQ